jgi:hypothetical protein
VNASIGLAHHPVADLLVSVDMYALAGEASLLVVHIGIVDADDRGFVSPVGVGPEFFQGRPCRGVDETVTLAPAPLVDYPVAFGPVSASHPRDFIISYRGTMISASLLSYSSFAGFNGVLPDKLIFTPQLQDIQCAMDRDPVFRLFGSRKLRRFRCRGGQSKGGQEKEQSMETDISNPSCLAVTPDSCQLCLLVILDFIPIRCQTSDTMFLVGQPRAERGVACLYWSGGAPAPPSLIQGCHHSDDALVLASLSSLRPDLANR